MIGGDGDVPIDGPQLEIVRNGPAARSICSTSTMAKATGDAHSAMKSS